MSKNDIIATYYINAKELIKQNNPKAARSYVLQILNAAVKTYNSATSILLKAKTAAFLDRWILVSKELYEKGITDYVLECFGLNPEPKEIKEEILEPAKDTPKQELKSPSSDDIDYQGLIEDTSSNQGWGAELFNKNKKAVVQLLIQTPVKRITGTGFIISKNGYLLTNDHIVYDTTTSSYFNNIKMFFINDKKSYNVKVLFSDKKTDTALCQFDVLEIDDFTTINFIKDYNRVLQGADCLVIGNPFGMGITPVKGIIRFTKDEDGDLIHSALSNPGDSGGPVLNLQGECIGINKSKIIAIDGTTADGYSAATTSEVISKVLYKWTSNNNIEL